MKKITSRTRTQMAIAAIAVAATAPVFAVPHTVSSFATSAEDLINTLLPGGINVTSASYTGVNPADNSPTSTVLVNHTGNLGGTTFTSQIGTFAGALGTAVSSPDTGKISGLPFDSGILLSTGNLLNSLSRNNSSRVNQDTYNLGIGPESSSAQLESIIDADLPGTPLGDAGTFDAVTLSFTFTTTFQKISFQYAFASDEYFEQVGIKNDAFAFIFRDLTTGSLPINLAKIGSSPVAVDSVNATTNPNYFLNNPFVNSTGTSSPYLIEYDGIAGGATKLPLFATTPNLNPNHVYQIDLVIADAEDGQGDSAVFIGAGTFIEGPPPGTVPEPSTYVGAMVLAGLIARKLRRKA